MTKFYIKYLILFTGLGAFNTYLPVYLERTLHFTSSQIGLIVSIPSIIGITFVPIWGIISDVLKKEKKVLCLNILLSLILTIAYLSTKSFIMVFLVAIFFEMFKNSLLPLTDSISTAYCNENNKNYGRIRVLGSIGFASSAFICGQVTKISENDLIFFYIFMISMIGCLFITPTLSMPRNLVSKEKVNLKKDLPNLLKNKEYILILLVSICIISLSEGIASYQGIYLLDMGAGKDLIGMLVIFMVMPELYFMVKTKSLIQKYGTMKMITIASMGLLFRWIVYIVTNNIWVFMIATSIHGMATAIVTIAVFDFIGKIIGKNLYTTSMTIYTFSIGIGSSLIKLLYGYLIDIFGMQSMFIASIIISMISFVIINKIIKLEKVKSNKFEII